MGQFEVKITQYVDQQHGVLDIEGSLFIAESKYVANKALPERDMAERRRQPMSHDVLIGLCQPVLTHED